MASEEELQRAADGIVEDYELEAFEFDEKMMTRHILQLMGFCVGIIIIILVELDA